MIAQKTNTYLPKKGNGNYLFIKPVAYETFCVLFYFNLFKTKKKTKKHVRS